MEQAGEITSNLRRAEGSWEDEVLISPEQERMLAAANLEVGESKSAHAQELVAELHEEAVHRNKVLRWEDQERWQGAENEEMRLVRIMHPLAIFRALRRAGVDARPESPLVQEWGIGTDGTPQLLTVVRNACRLWLNAEPRAGRIGVNAWVPNPLTGRREPKTLTTLQEPYGPEWSLMHFDKVGVATAERYRGWRTAMLQLIIQGVLTEAEVERAFGYVVPNRASESYRKQLQAYRSQRMGVTA